MGLLTKQPRQRSFRLPDEHQPGIRHQVYRATGLRIDLDLLDDAETVELYGLCNAIRESGKEEGVERSSPNVLDAKSRKRWEALVCKAAGIPGDHFAMQRKLAQAEAERLAEARRPHEHATRWTTGTVVLPASMFRGLQQGDLDAVPLLLLTIIAAAVENKVALHSRMRVEEDGTVVVKVAEDLVAPLDQRGNVSGVANALKRLAMTNALDVVRTGGEVRIRLGDTLAAALEQKAKK
jgi:hypothetical protein